MNPWVAVAVAKPRGVGKCGHEFLQHVLDDKRDFALPAVAVSARAHDFDHVAMVVPRFSLQVDENPRTLVRRTLADPASFTESRLDRA